MAVLDPKAEVHDRPLPEGGLTPIRIRPGDKWSHRRNSLKRQRAWRILHEQYWRVIRTGMVGSGSYADRPKHSYNSCRYLND
jgi:hypothetical protein